ncbi:hypothetical protein [Kordia sp.]|uniref:hypothetical protein n=1 Tax=Kordia sp. TaxID=1965332 RepID=UPI003D29377A
MKHTNDLIIVHFQEGFFDNTNQDIKSTVLSTLTPMVKNAIKANMHVSFWEDVTSSDPTSIIDLSSFNKKVSREDAPGGVNKSYIVHGAEITLTGGWFGACIKNAIRSILLAFFKNKELIKTGELTIRMPSKAVYDENELLADMSDANIGLDIVDALERSAVLNQLEVRERGLQVRIAKSKTQETILEKILVAVPHKPTLQIFDVVFLID